MVVVLCSIKLLSVINNKGQQLLNYAKERYGSCTLHFSSQVKFQVDTVSVLCSGQNIRIFSVKQLGHLKPNSIWHHHGIGVKMESLLSFFSLHMFFFVKRHVSGRLLKSETACAASVAS